jgi:hypothetical protein
LASFFCILWWYGIQTQGLTLARLEPLHQPSGFLFFSRCYFFLSDVLPAFPSSREAVEPGARGPHHSLHNAVRKFSFHSDKLNKNSNES